jgi:hypothetical protein
VGGEMGCLRILTNLLDSYAFEVTVAFAQLFLAFGLGLDPRNASSFGPALAPLLIGMSSALMIFFTGFARKGYLGVCECFSLRGEVADARWVVGWKLILGCETGNNPARCLGLMTAANRFDYHYIHWAGDISACL